MFNKILTEMFRGKLPLSSLPLVATLLVNDVYHNNVAVTDHVIIS